MAGADLAAPAKPIPRLPARYPTLPLDFPPIPTGIRMANMRHDAVANMLPALFLVMPM